MTIPEIEELLAKITPGEWSCEMNILYGPNDDGTGISMDNTDDAIFIAAAPRMIRQLLAQVKEFQNCLVDVQAKGSVRQQQDTEICEGILMLLAGAGIPTPEETYGSNIHWAFSDLSRAFRKLDRQPSDIQAQLSRTQKAGEALANYIESAVTFPNQRETILQNWKDAQKP